MYIHIPIMALKVLHVFLDEEQKERLEKVKKESGLNWVDFVMQLAEE